MARCQIPEDLDFNIAAMKMWNLTKNNVWTKDHTFSKCCHYLVHNLYMSTFCCAMSNYNHFNPCMFKHALCNNQNGIWNSVMEVMKISNRISVEKTFNIALHEKIHRAKIWRLVWPIKWLISNKPMPGKICIKAMPCSNTQM